MDRMTIEDIGDAALTARTSPLLLEGRAPQREARQPKPALSPEAREKANEQLKGYSFTVGEDGYFHNSAKGTRTMVELRFKKGRFEAWGAGSKQWSGPDVGWFVEHFWFDKKKAG